MGITREEADRAFGQSIFWMVVGMLFGSFGAGTAAVVGLWWVWAIVVGMIVLSVVMYCLTLKKGME